MISFYKETEFQESEIGEIPESWESIKIDKIVKESLYGPRFSSKLYDNNGNVKTIRGTDVTVKGKIKYSSVPIAMLDKELIKTHKLLQNDLVVVTTADCGLPVIFEEQDIDYIPSAYMVRYRLDTKKISPRFIHSILFMPKIKQQILNFVRKGTVANLPGSDFLKVSIPFPKVLEEQQKIALVLTTIDDSIETIDKELEKWERIKKTTMKKLFSEGIGHTEFKETEIGIFPKDWKIKSLEECTLINENSIDPIKKLDNEEFYYIDIDSVENGTGKIGEAKRIKAQDAPSRAKRQIFTDNVIMSTVRPYLKAFAIVPEKYNNQVCSTGFAVMSCKGDLTPLFLLYILLSDIVINQCTVMMVGGQYPALNTKQVESIIIPVPSTDEQQKVAQILTAIDDTIEIKKKKKEKLERIKKKIMTLLLTGQVRIVL